MLDRALQARTADYAIPTRAEHPGLRAFVVKALVEANKRAIIGKLHVVTLAVREFDFDRPITKHGRAHNLPGSHARALCPTG